MQCVKTTCFVLYFIITFVLSNKHNIMQNQDPNQDNKNVENFKGAVVSGENIVGGKAYTIVKPYTDSPELPGAVNITEVTLGDNSNNPFTAVDNGTGSAFSVDVNEI